MAQTMVMSATALNTGISALQCHIHFGGRSASLTARFTEGLGSAFALLSLIATMLEPRPWRLPVKVLEWLRMRAAP
jgi:hypothetical protein